MDRFVIKRKASEMDIEILPDTITGIPQNDINAINQHIISHTVKRKKYASLTVAQKLEVGRFAMQHGNSVALKQFSDKYDLKETSVRNYKKFAAKYKDTEPTAVPNSPRGRPKVMSDAIVEQIQGYIVAQRDAGGIISTVSVQATITAVLKGEAPLLLKENGGPLNINPMFAWRLLDDMKWTKRAVNGDKGSLPPNWEEKKAVWNSEIKAIIETDEIHDDMVINFDQTGVKLVPCSEYTYAPKGTTDVSATGSNDKREITAVLAGSKSGNKLPPQLIYTGKTQRSLPKVGDDVVPSDYHLTVSDSHWSTETTMLSYVDHIIKPYFEKTRERHSLPSTAKGLVLLDVYKVHRMESVITALKHLHLNVKFIPGSMTSKCQPMDLTVNKSLKSDLKNSFNIWYSDEIRKAMDSGADITAVAKSINLAMSRVKPLATKWFIHAWEQVSSATISKGFTEAGI